MPWVGNKLRATRSGGETDPAVLRGLACGAHLSYSNGARWNSVADPRPAPAWERTRLKVSWDVTSPHAWHQTVQELLDGQLSTPMWDAAMGARAALLTRSPHVPVTEQAWSEATGRWLVDRLGPHHPELSGRSQVLRVVGARVLRYEARFREDGLLAQDASVRRTLAWDLGRAANMCCWGVNAGFAGLDEARQALHVIGETAAEEYPSWSDFSLGYVLGRCLHFDEDSFGPWYREVRTSHRLLTSRPESPWAVVGLRG
ncbi:DUF1266 domain-containing protein [Streptomyces tubbatahanensis]|uniref:DUF1266 domain-containing protein n=1 Tax=Streptomyces tubbatahanensis TaxID=2923272 RepID=A0ABY3XY59_9ACTN|nr:DUF1266 domain-containing protein [Streptomyces tubbatahanensis]UNS99469.1 DUF1266 domain-containing protein [Streptomyces tubbatahanensis]